MIKQMGLDIIYIKMLRKKSDIGLMIFYLEYDMNLMIMNIIVGNFKIRKKMV